MSGRNDYNKAAASRRWRRPPVPASDITLSCNTALFHGEVHEIFVKNANERDGEPFNTRSKL